MFQLKHWFLPSSIIFISSPIFYILWIWFPFKHYIRSSAVPLISLKLRFIWEWNTCTPIFTISNSINCAPSINLLPAFCNKTWVPLKRALLQPGESSQESATWWQMLKCDYKYHIIALAEVSRHAGIIKKAKRVCLLFCSRGNMKFHFVVAIADGSSLLSDSALLNIAWWKCSGALFI